MDLIILRCTFFIIIIHSQAEICDNFHVLASSISTRFRMPTRVAGILVVMQKKETENYRFLEAISLIFLIIYVQNSRNGTFARQNLKLQTTRVNPEIIMLCVPR